MGARKNPLHNLDTYVFIDVSNIRWACLKTLNLWLEFAELADYFRRKYPNLKDLRYYEGIALGDTKKQKTFAYLARKGYTICPLERKSYNSTESEKREIKCPRCGNEWPAEFRKVHRTMKSNVDVYLASELLGIAYAAAHPLHIIIVACDGDYAEMIKCALRNPNVTISVLATPSVRDWTKNTLSTRLKRIFVDYPPQTKRYQLQGIDSLDCFTKNKTQK